jgi:4-diphosphocytidyl-2-C-methyl-D-erythritol kinase
VILRAPAKVNLCLLVGRPREDGLHPLCSLFEALSLADRIVLSEAEEDEVVCAEVDDTNLAAIALAALRGRGWERPAMRLEIEKRIPVAAGLGGGSADAAAVLRLAAGEVEGVAELAAEIGSDVPSQLDPGLAVVSGVGEVVEPLATPREHAFVLIAQDEGLSTAEVYAEADRLGIGRDAAELEAARERLVEVAGTGASPLDYPELLVNDLEPAALSLRPSISEALDALREVGAAAARVTGSGPTAFGLFADIAEADRAAYALPPRYAGALVASPASYA